MLERRPVADTDEPFLRELFAATRPEFALLPPEARETVLELQVRAQRSDWTLRFPASAHELIVLEGSPVGRIWVAWLPEECRIVDLSLIPAHQGVGIGTQVVDSVLRRAGDARVPVAINVAQANNRAIAFWERFGFAASGGDELYLSYLRPLSTAPPPPVSRAPSR